MDVEGRVAVTPAANTRKSAPGGCQRNTSAIAVPAAATTATARIRSGSGASVTAREVPMTIEPSTVRPAASCILIRSLHSSQRP